MTGEWRHRTIAGSVLAAPNRVRLLAAKAISYSVAGIALSIIVTVPTIIVGELVLSGRGLSTLGAGGIADVLWRNLAVAALLGPLGVCVGAMIRNQIVTVIGLIIIAAAIEPARIPGGPGSRSPPPARRRSRRRPRRHPRGPVARARARGHGRLDTHHLRGSRMAPACPRPHLTQTSRQTTNGPPPTAAGGPWSPGRSVGSAARKEAPCQRVARPSRLSSTPTFTSPDGAL